MISFFIIMMQDNIFQLVLLLRRKPQNNFLINSDLKAADFPNPINIQFVISLCKTE